VSQCTPIHHNNKGEKTENNKWGDLKDRKTLLEEYFYFCEPLGNNCLISDRRQDITEGVPHFINHKHAHNILILW
jgi:hypothetical protein